MTTVVVLCRLLLAATFMVSGVAKLLDREGTRTATRAFGISMPLVPVVAITLPVTELLAVVLLAGSADLALMGAALTLVLLVVFSALIARSLANGRQVECRCFGALSDAPLSGSALIRNGILAGLAVAVLATPAARRGDSLPGWLASTPAPTLATALALVVLSASVIVLTRFSTALLRRHGQVLLRLEALEALEAPEVGGGATWRSTTSRSAPPVTLPNLDGGESSLSALAEAAPRGQLLVIFMAEACLPCEQLVRKLPRFVSEWAAALPVAVVATGDREGIEAKFHGVTDVPVLITSGISEQLAYAVAGTPAAVIIERGDVVAGPVGGVEDIEKLWRVAATAPRGDLDPGPVHQIEARPRMIGDLISDLMVSHSDGQQERLSAVVQGKEHVLLYWDSSCGFCTQLAPSLVETLDARPNVIVISLDAPGTTVDFPGRVVYANTSLATALDLPGTPSAIRVDADGRLSSGVAAGGPAVLELLSR